MRCPAAFNLTIKASVPRLRAVPDDAAGKLLEVVLPTTYAAPDASTAMPLPTSSPEPPRYVEYTSEAPVGFILVTKGIAVSATDGLERSWRCGEGRASGLAAHIRSCRSRTHYRNYPRQWRCPRGKCKQSYPDRSCIPLRPRNSVS